MRLYEIITIYLAAGAPVGVTCFLHRRTRRSFAHALAAASAVWLVWPVSLIQTLLEQSEKFARLSARANDVSDEQSHERKIERAAHALALALYAVEDAYDETRRGNDKIYRQIVFAARRSVERFTGLALIVAQERQMPEHMPTKREMETCRIAGRTGDDLLIAGLCIRRRGRARLFAHYKRACTELVHALAGVRELLDREGFASPHEYAAARSVSEKIIRVYASAIEVLSLLDEQTTAIMVARLLDAECARLRRLETACVGNERHFEQPLQPATLERCL